MLGIDSGSFDPETLGLEEVVPVHRPHNNRLAAGTELQRHKTHQGVPGELSMANGIVIRHSTRGYLADYDPWGKQEFLWSTDIKEAWVFKTEKQANSAIRWMPRETLSLCRIASP